MVLFKLVEEILGPAKAALVVENESVGSGRLGGWEADLPSGGVNVKAESGTETETMVTMMSQAQRSVLKP